MTYDFDVTEFCDNLKATKPPYQCPVEGCRRLYKTWVGIQFHMYKYDHENPDSCGSSAPAGKKTNSNKKKGKSHHRSMKRSPTPPEVNFNSHRETLTYAEAQRVVEIDLNGKLRRVNIYEPLKVVKKVPKKEGADVQNESIKTEKDLEKVTPQSNKKKPPNLNLSKKPSSPVKLPEAHFKLLDEYAKPKKKHIKQSGFYRYIEKSTEELDEETEYDMDDQDNAWLKIINRLRKREGVSVISTDMFEYIMDRFEKEAHFQSQSTGESAIAPIDEDAVCSICMDGECQNSNVILFCDMCNLAVHQECYGVPYIPEGQWLCRRCLQSPSRGVDCCLCPNKGGAFKQTDDGRWAHVICAIWIPEVVFANTVFLEPVDGIQNIPPARWKLTCYICKQKNIGACIQCHKTNCYTAFHVTCAQQAGLYMKVESVKSSVPTSPSGIAIRKTAFCDIHTPANMKGTSMVANSDSETNDKSAQEKARIKMRKARKILAEKRNAVPVVNIPIIPELSLLIGKKSEAIDMNEICRCFKRLQAITAKLRIAKKESLFPRLMAYWTLKRQSRNGVPLLRRLQSNHMTRPQDQQPAVDSKEAAAANAQLKYWKRLRQDLEKARLLVELIRKREKLKREELRLHSAIVDMKLTPLTKFLQKVLDEVKEVDTASVFAQPVDVNEVPDYLEYITSPMDLSTIQYKVVHGVYNDFYDFQADIELMVKNCMVYNSKDTPFYKMAIKMKEQGGAILRAAQRMYEYIGFESGTGLLLENRPDGVVNPQDKSQLPCLENINHYLEELSAKNLPSEEHMELVMDQLELAILQKGRKWKVSKLLRKEILRIKKQTALTSDAANEPLSAMDESSAEDTDTVATPIAPVINDVIKQTVVKPESLEIESSRTKKTDDVSSSPMDTSSTSQPAAPSPGTVNRRTAVLFASKKLARRQPPLVTSPLATVTQPSQSTSNKDADHTHTHTTHTSSVKKSANKAQSHKNKAQVDSEKQKGQTSTASTQTKKRSAESNSEEPEAKKPSGLQRQDSFSKSRGGNFATTLLSASELEELSTTDTEASDSESEHTSADDALGGSISAGSSTARRLRSADDKYSVPLTALDLVWAKCRGYPWYPAMIVDPKIPKGYTFNGVPIPKPPQHVLDLQKKFSTPVYLILFFDAKRTWQWLPRDKLEPLGVDSEYDQQKLSENKKPNTKKAVMSAYEKAIRHQRKIDDGDDDEEENDNNQ